MPKSTAELTKPEKISKEFRRLKRIFSKVPANKLGTVMPLIQNAAFMKVTLDELQYTINQNGCSDEYQNGANQFGTKASAELQAYNSLIKNYSSVCNSLLKLVPAEEKQESRLSMMMNE